MNASKSIEEYYAEWGLDKKQDQLRKDFAKAYVDTSPHPPYRDPVQAASKIGFRAPYDEEWARFFMRDGPTLRYIDEAHKSKLKEYSTVSDEDIFNQLWELSNDGSGPAHASRVAAKIACAKIRGLMDGKDDETDKDKPKGSVILLPKMPTMSDWEKLAKQSQARLKEKVKE